MGFQCTFVVCVENSNKSTMSFLIFCSNPVDPNCSSGGKGFSSFPYICRVLNFPSRSFDQWVWLGQHFLFEGVSEKGRSSTAGGHAPARRANQRLTSFQEAPSTIQTAVPPFIPELIPTLQEAEAHGLPQGLGQPGFSAAEPLLTPGQAHLLALLEVRLPRGGFIGEGTWQEHQGFSTCQPESRNYNNNNF